MHRSVNNNYLHIHSRIFICIILYFCRSFDETLPDEILTHDLEVTYRVLKGVTQRGKDKLVDNQGYSFTVKVIIHYSFSLTALLLYCHIFIKYIYKNKH